MTNPRILRKLENYVKKYFLAHQNPKPKLITINGSLGKTTTKAAIATMLAAKFRVSAEFENRDQDFSTPLAILGISDPPKEIENNFTTWRKIFAAAKSRVKSPTNVDFIVAELPARKPGEIAHFAEYLQPDIAVITAVAPEDMENFADISAVAREQLATAKFANLTVINRDDIDMSFAPFAETTNITDYGLGLGEYRFENIRGNPLDGYSVNFYAPEFATADQTANMSVINFVPAKVFLAGEPGLRAALAAATVGAKIGLSQNEIAQNLANLKPFPGRMNILDGVRNSKIIDDTYSSSPRAAIAALLTLYQIDVEQRIAILGSMNHLGEKSAEYHAAVGAQCDPNWLDWVITIGEDAARWLAPAARKNGCQVATFPDPVAAGAFANKILKTGAVVLAKGSQDKVFAEEAVKILLAHAEDAEKLVRQDKNAMEKSDAYISSVQAEIGE